MYGVFATPLEEPWDGAIHAALEEAAADGVIQYKHVDDLSTSDAMERALRDIAVNEKPAAIMGDAFAAEEAVRKVAAEFPDIPFAFGSGEEPVEPNMSVFDNWLQDPAYLAGMLAGGLTESDTIGVVGAMPIPEVNRIVNAFVLGVKETNPDATVKVSFINSFFDPAAAKQAAQAHVSAGADVLFAERDGVIAAAEEADIPVIGMMVDQKEEAPEHVVTSLIWNVRPTVDAVIAQIEERPRGRRPRGVLVHEGGRLLDRRHQRRHRGRRPGGPGREGRGEGGRDPWTAASRPRSTRALPPSPSPSRASDGPADERRAGARPAARALRHHQALRRPGGQRRRLAHGRPR